MGIIKISRSIQIESTAFGDDFATMKILASVTDDSAYQPQGNTQQLQDFTRFLYKYQIKNRLTAGDFWIKNKDSYFLKYHKRGQGIHLKIKL